MAIEIRLVTDKEEIKEIYEFIKQQPYDYPNYLIWVEKCMEELTLGYKKAFICKIDNKIVANLIAQRHKKDSNLFELKNGRVEEGDRRKKIFTNLYSFVEKFAKEKGFKAVVCDTHMENTAVIKTMESLGFKIKATEKLYDDKKLETIMIKRLE